MKEISCTIVGVTPLMMYRYVHGYATPKVVENVRDECEKRLHFASNGEFKKGTVVVPQEAIFRTIMNGGKFEKLGKKQVTTEKSSLLPGYAMFPGFEYELKNSGWEADMRTAVTSRGDRVPIYRPRFDKWSLTFLIQLLYPETFGEDLMRRIIDHAGQKIGLLSFRPERKGGFGMFRVDGWKTAKS